jgi:hypothetical protein
MPVTETLELEARLRDELGMSLDGILVNALLPDRLRGADAGKVADATAAGSAAARAALEATLSAHETARAQRSQLARLRRGATADVASLPHLLTADVGRDDLERLSRALERKL